MATFTLARLTFLEAIRRRIALAALLLGLAFLVLYGAGFYFIIRETGLPATSDAMDSLLRSQVYNFLSNAGMYAVNFLSLAMGALVSADTLAGEIGSGTIQSLVTRPVRRAEIVLGKWLGFAGLLALYLALMGGGLLLVVYLLAGYHVPNAAAGISLIYLEALLIMSLTVACSSRFSTLATGGAVFGLYGVAFIGGWVEQIGALLHNQTAVNIGILSSLLIPSEALFRRAAFVMTSPLVQRMGVNFGPMFVFSVPSPLMVVYAVLYLAAALAVAVWQFERRDL
ncbi:MAG: ABC transporter permease [Chloroflexi bacterium]|nr:ABC transporter permease [Chloroflexota bacterium]